jgi:predicted AlkP superfamily pyrophosphatase or phosphodiesterase
MSRWVKRKCGFTGYFQLYAVPFKYLPLFNYAEQKRIWEPGGLPHGKTIFDLMAEKSIPYYVHDSDAHDEARLEQLMAEVQSRCIEFAYCSLGRLDALMHAEGNDSPAIGKLMEWYDDKIRALLDAAGDNYDEVAWYLFTDHGMHNVTETYDLQADVEALGLGWNRDYVAFYDATMLRVWLLTDTGRESIVRLLSNHPKGHLLSEAELKTFGVYFEDGKYGDLIFLMNTGVQIVPGFMGAHPVKGMHGYHPAAPDSLACIASNKPIPRAITRIQHIHQLMLDELGLRLEA